MNHNIPSWYIPTETATLGHSACDVCGVELPEDRPEVDGKKYCPDHMADAPGVWETFNREFHGLCQSCDSLTHLVHHERAADLPTNTRPAAPESTVCAACGSMRLLPHARRYRNLRGRSHGH